VSGHTCPDLILIRHRPHFPLPPQVAGKSIPALRAASSIELDAQTSTVFPMGSKWILHDSGMVIGFFGITECLD
jgi:hypothetical protein